MAREYESTSAMSWPTEGDSRQPENTRVPHEIVDPLLKRYSYWGYNGSRDKMRFVYSQTYKDGNFWLSEHNEGDIGLVPGKWVCAYKAGHTSVMRVESKTVNGKTHDYARLFECDGMPNPGVKMRAAGLKELHRNDATYISLESGEFMKTFYAGAAPMEDPEVQAAFEQGLSKPDHDELVFAYNCWLAVEALENNQAVA